MELQTYLRTAMSDGMQNGRDLTAGRGQVWVVGYTGGLPTSQEYIRLLLTDLETSDQVLVGGGPTSSIEPTFCFTHNNKVYLLAGDSTYFSEIEEPTVWNDPEGVGNGFVKMSNHTKTPENLVAIGRFQGRLVFMSRQTTQIWSTPEDPAGWALQQVLDNRGTLAPLSVQNKGDLDLFMLSDTGIRNLRAQAETLNAFPDDIGAPIDSVIQDKILTYPEDAANACAVVEPSTGQYWLFLKDTIYVLTHFPSSKVVAWSNFTPIDSEGTTFTPEKFVIFQGKVYCRSGNTVLVYGGSSGVQYDHTKAVAEIPWSDLKSPGVEKSAVSLSVALSGHWRIYAGMDPFTEELVEVYNKDKPSFGMGMVDVGGVGTHLKLRMECQSDERAIFSSVAVQFEGGDTK